ncbi:hypothetical protein IWQ56_002328, partial [Coemansia nantahalensis]
MGPGVLRLAALVAAATAPLLGGVAGRTSSSSFPLVAQYEFLAEPVVHRYAEHPVGGGQLGRRSFHERLPLGAMVADGTYHIAVRAYNTTYALILEPNDDLLHPDATLVRSLPGRRQVREPLRSSDIGVFRGHVVRVGAVAPRDRSASLRKWELHRRGQYSFDERQTWARLAVFHDARGRPVLDGVFGVDGETFHVKPADTYMRTRHADDPVLTNPLARAPEMRHAGSIIYRRSDLARPPGRRANQERDNGRHPEHTCGAQRLAPDAVPPRLSPGDPLYPVRTARGVLGGLSRRATAFDGGKEALSAG